MLCLGDFKVFYKGIKGMYKIEHLPTFLSYNQRPCAPGGRKCYTDSSKATGRRPAPSL